MTDAIIARTDTAPPKSEPKGRIIERLLKRARGASVAELTADTGWQPHSVRAFFTGLRKKGIKVARDKRKSGETYYRIIKPAIAAKPDAIAMPVDKPASC